MMKFLIVVVAFVAMVSAKPNPIHQNINEELNEEWVAYKSAHAKNYASKEEIMRRLIWEENLRFIQTHNLAYSRGEKSYTVGMNKYGDLTPSEFVSKFNGYRSKANQTKGSTFLSSSTPITLPATVDWRTKGYVTPVKDQQQCGSCWAFSTTGSLEGQMFKKTGKLVSLSEQNLVDCSQSFGNNGCGGGLMDYAFAYIKQNGGIDTEVCYPYTAMDGDKCLYKASCKSGEDTGYTDITSGSESELQQAVATVGPISVAIDASQQSFQLYQSGVYDEPDCSSTQLDHGVLAVGYGTLEGKDYWLVKNSWGTTWGLKGYLMMSRNKNNQCGIATAASYPLV